MEEVLIARLRKRDETAVTQLYDLYSASLYGVILRIVKDELLAEEVIQDCFVKIWVSIALYDSNKGRLFTWMVTIARHLAIDKIRSCSYQQKRQNQYSDIILKNSSYETNSFKPECIGIKEFISILSVDQRKVVDLIYFEGYSHQQAAKELTIPLGTVKTRVRQALQLLRKLLVEPTALAA